MRKNYCLILILALIMIIGTAKIQAQPLYPAQKITIANLTLTTADTEYNYTLPNNCISFSVKARGSGTFKIAFTSGQSGTAYETVPSGGVFSPDIPLLLTGNRTFYAQSSTAGMVLEIRYYE